MNSNEILIEQHSFSNSVVFYFKVAALTVLRFIRNNFINRTRKFPKTNHLRSMSIVGSSETDLWYADDNEHNWMLTAGKVENLRVAGRRLNGVEVAANSVFSFWRHVGNPNIGRQFVIGRELREGCIVPTIAGGLCQLSNALYDAALKAGFEIVERHKHTRVIKGSLAEVDRDATVKWNYLDLRFKSAHAFRIEIEITHDKLLVRFRSESKNISTPLKQVAMPPSKLNDCYSCGNFECFKHPGKAVFKNERALTTYLLDERWSEYELYIKGVTEAKDFFIVPSIAYQPIKISRYVWNEAPPTKSKAVIHAAVVRAIALRVQGRRGKNVFASMLRGDERVAQAMARRIPIATTHVVVSQNLLPFLWQHGVLAGRTFDVLMTRLPMETLHHRLDEAFLKYPESKTLHDFRADDALIALESEALTKAHRIITPHAVIASLFNNKSMLLPWTIPTVKRIGSGKGEQILFPASALARKGAYEMRQLARALRLSLKIIGDATEDDNFWGDVHVTPANGNVFENVKLVVYPAYVEHQPRLVLKAIALGIPVIVSDACGIPRQGGVTIISAGDYVALERAVRAHLSLDTQIASVAV